MIAIPEQEYARPDGFPLRYDFFRPNSQDELPVVIFVHGGGWISGDRQMYRDEAIWLANVGYACALFDYRLAPLSPFPAAVQDAQSFVRFIRNHSSELGVVPDKVIAFGNSAGGHLAAMLGLFHETFGAPNDPKEHLVNGVIALSAITDIRKPSESQFDISLSFVEQFMGGPLKGREDLYASASPVAHVNDDACPFLIVHGSEDDIVPPSQSSNLHAALLLAGGESRLIQLEGEEHSYSPTGWQAIRDAYLAFLGSTVGAPPK
ncbi:MAG: alpha/beta hydrolase [Armatimonadetes bacterium]|nr:alpha/beta hydrolase [Armatimonadota bacterium]